MRRERLLEMLRRWVVCSLIREAHVAGHRWTRGARLTRMTRESLGTRYERRWTLRSCADCHGSSYMCRQDWSGTIASLFRRHLVRRSNRYEAAES